VHSKRNTHLTPVWLWNAILQEDLNGTSGSSENTRERHQCASCGQHYPLFAAVLARLWFSESFPVANISECDLHSSTCQSVLRRGHLGSCDRTLRVIASALTFDGRARMNDIQTSMKKLFTMMIITNPSLHVIHLIPRFSTMPLTINS
jgi:hypothetical protein